MPAKKTKKKTTKAKPKKTTKAAAKKKVTTKKKVAKKKKAPAKAEKALAYECGICGYRLIVDEVCGCAEEHVFVCCNKVMKKKGKKKAA